MIRSRVYIKYVEFAGQGGCSRSEAAAYFNVHKTTAQYNLEKAVELGDLEKWWGYVDDNQSGWLYRQVGSNQELPFGDDGSEYDAGHDWEGEREPLVESGELSEEWPFETEDWNYWYNYYTGEWEVRGER